MAAPEITGRKAITSRDLRRRYGKCWQTIYRWKKTGVIPPPDFIINRIDHWWETTIEANERRMVSLMGAGKAPVAAAATEKEKPDAIA